MADLAQEIMDRLGLQDSATTQGRMVEKFARQSVRSRMYAARGFGEMASMASAPAATVFVDNVLHAPYEDLKTRIAKHIVEPNLEWWNQLLVNAKSIDNPEERRERQHLPRAEQAKKITDLLVDLFGVKFTASLLGQYLTQDFFIRLFDAPVKHGENMMTLAVDRGVQLGGIVALNTVASKQAIALQNMLVKQLKKVGVDEEKAEDWASYAVNFSLSNAVAYLISSELLTHYAKKAR